MADVPQTDWDRIHAWEWQRRSEWRQGYVTAGKPADRHSPIAATST